MIHLLLFIVLFFNGIQSTEEELHVSTQGNDSNSGSIEAPLLTIQKAAEIVQPGQTIIIHEGTYREYINPPIGGNSPDNRVTFKSADGATVLIKGSEEIKEWLPAEGRLWKIELDTSFFEGYNPYTLQVDGDYQNYGQWHTRGDVYVNNSPLSERKTLKEAEETDYTWYTTTSGGVTTIYANFGEYNPKEELIEINVRELIFFATDTDVNYITLDGLRFLHAAPNWQAPNTGDNDPNRLLHVGAVGSNMGTGWIIENSEIAHSKTAGIMFGENAGPESSFEDVTQFGDHIIRNNYIHKNGQYGIAGQKGISRSEISGNRIESINYRNEFGGYEPAGIKIWNSSDVLIEHNAIQHVVANQSNLSQAYCIWIDYANQGTRITRNFLIADKQTTTALFLEANVGPTLVDNNVIIDKKEGAIMVYSGGSIFAHNLFINSNFDFRIQEFDNEGSGARRAYTLKPHSTVRTNMGIPVEIEHNQMYNNIFLFGNGPKDFGPHTGTGNRISHNLYAGGATPREGHEYATTRNVFFSYNHWVNSEDATLTINLDTTYSDIETPTVSPELVGVIPLAQQSIADEHANPITVTWDFNKKARRDRFPLVGPFSDIQLGDNTFSIKTPLKPTPSKRLYRSSFTNQ